MKKKNKKTKASSPSPLSSNYHVEISKIGVTQICNSIGYKSFQSSALETLTSITINYIQTLASSAATSASSTCRTHSNLYDVIIALHHLHSHTGFIGNSNPNSSLTDSTLLIDLMKHVNRTREVPFAKPLPCGTYTEPVFSVCEKSAPRGTHRDELLSVCEDSKSEKRSGEVLFGRMLPLGTHRDKVISVCEKRKRHVPRWLPGFPEVKDDGKKLSVTVVNEGEKDMKKEVCLDREVSELPKLRRKVCFKLGGEKPVWTAVNEVKNVIEVKVGGCKLGKRILCDVYGNDVNDTSKKKVVQEER